MCDDRGTRRRIVARAARHLVPAYLGGIALGRQGDRTALRRLEARASRRILRDLEVSVRVLGAPSLPDRPSIVLPLHESLLDPAVLAATLPGPLTFVGRDEFLSWRLLGPYLRTAGHPLIRPERPRAAARTLLEQVGSILEAGSHVVIFPQGSILGVEIAFQAGAMALAERCSVPVVPVVLAGTHRVWRYPFGPELRTGATVHLAVLPVTEPLHGARARGLERRMKRMAIELGARRYVPARDGWWDGYAFDIDPDFPQLTEAVARRRARLGEVREELQWT